MTETNFGDTCIVDRVLFISYFIIEQLSSFVQKKSFLVKLMMLFFRQ